MSIFNAIMTKIFQHPGAQEQRPERQGQQAQGHASQIPLAQQQMQGQPQSSPAPQQVAEAMGVPQTQPQNSPPPPRSVDVQAVLARMSRDSGQRLKWDESIVDLLKLLRFDSSLAVRRELARELGYTGSADDSTAMDLWLHRQVMQKLARNGATVSPDMM
jgi:hypothetical protein